MVSEELKVGDVVYLKSGSPPLTVAQVAGRSVSVTWMESGKFTHDLSLNAACFTKKKRDTFYD